jgi:hypothetical protein
LSTPPAYGAMDMERENKVVHDNTLTKKCHVQSLSNTGLLIPRLSDHNHYPRTFFKGPPLSRRDRLFQWKAFDDVGEFLAAALALDKLHTGDGMRFRRAIFPPNLSVLRTFCVLTSPPIRLKLSVGRHWSPPTPPPLWNHWRQYLAKYI